ncbi:monocarboxylate transporter 13-like [Patiria miniata]|uniref:Major facilitator superfamily (MFS) profile domain-containing protein n=1 Tax=Patiria miniata TaxID=46514 RepID=A0A914A1I9_PATMI|nr:monocarboxylate transporter 13-like [Patiria miniata]
MALLDLRPFLKKYRGCFMVYIAFVELFIALGPPYGYTILFARLQDEFGAGAALTGWVGSLATTLVFCSPVSPLLLQRLGPRAVALLGTVVFSAGLVATSFVPALPYAFLTFGVLVGVGGNFLVQSVVLVVFKWFPGRNCSRATSIAWLGTPFGTLAFAPLLTRLITAYGWRNCLRIVAGGSFVLSVAHAAFIALPNEKTENRETPESKTIDEHETVVDDNAHSAAAKECQTAEIDDHAPRNLRHQIGKLLLQLDTWAWLFGFLMSNIGWTFVVINYASFMEYDLHLTPDQITVALVLAAGGEIVGKILFSIFGDRLPCLKLYVVAATGFLAALMSGLMTVLKTLSLVYIISFVVGMIRGVSYVSPCPATMELFGDYGSNVVTALFMIPMGAGILVGAPLTGGLYDLKGDYTLSLYVTVGVFVCAALSMLSIPIRRRLRSGTNTSDRVCRSETETQGVYRSTTTAQISLDNPVFEGSRTDDDRVLSGI